MLSKQEVFAHYGSLFLQRTIDEDCAHRVAFRGIADDGADIRVYHSPNVTVWEEYVEGNRPVSLNELPEYRYCQIKRDGHLEFEESQAPVF